MTAPSHRSLPSARWLVPEDLTLPSILKEIEHDWRLTAKRRTVSVRRFFDTHEWSLFFDRLCLYVCQDTSRSARAGRDSGDRRNRRNTVQVAHLDQELSVADLPSIEWPAGAELPRFWWDFPPGELQDCLSKRLGLRALIDRGALRTSRLPIELKNADDKTVVRLTIESHSEDARPRHVLFKTLTATALRGYDDQLASFERTTATERLGLEQMEHSVFDELLAHQGLVPVRYTSKPKIEIAPHETLRDTIVKMLEASLDLVEANKQGTIDDIDTEFLHHFRTSVRRSRSLLSLVKGALGQDTEARLKRELRDLQQRTNRLRDLDVFLLDQSQFKALLPKSLHCGLAAWQQAVEKQRHQEHARLARFLKGATFERRMATLRTVTSEAAEGEASEVGSRLSVEAGPEIVHKRYRRVRKRGRAIDQQTPDAAIHSLRIDCKKLRYTLEFFESVLPDTTIDVVLPRLKKLQDVLGDFNDLAVQQEELRDMFEALDSGDEGSEEIALALGGLIAVLHSRYERQRNKVLRGLDGFVSGDAGVEIKAAFALLKPPETSEEQVER